MPPRSPDAFPLRPSGTVLPLVTAEQAFPEMERLIADARKSVWISMWVFDPDTPLTCPLPSGDKWRDLLALKLEQGVKVRIMLSDFDPIGATDLHRRTWRSVFRFAEFFGHQSLEILPIGHEALIGHGLRVGLWPVVMGKIEKMRREMNHSPRYGARSALIRVPGLWRFLRVNRKGRVLWRMPRKPRLTPVSLHQKILLADDSRAIIGGMDINERRQDDKDHQRRPGIGWHDVSVAVEGPVVGDIAAHLADDWNRACGRVAEVHAEWRRFSPTGSSPLPDIAKPVSHGTGAAETSTKDGVRLLRTRSRMTSRRFYGFSPQTELSEIESAHIDLFGKAQNWIYLETQYLRSKVISDALVAAAKRCPRLQLVVVLPAAPEEIAFEDHKGLGERFGEHLQSACVKDVRRAFGKKAAFLSPVRPTHSESRARDSLANAPIIYVHAKVSLVDGASAIVSSANLNGRSMRWDTEAGLLIEDRKHVHQLQKALFEHWWPEQSGSRAGQEPVDPMSALEAGQWMNLAEQNLERAPHDRTGFLVPYDNEEADQFGKALPGVPNELV